ncbi:protein ABHD18 isoform X2 [Frankliniella occidentalis]|uniref:Protein ABHD18 isoform X2 n=1 Tax=Frankliniella occidentalis TaxID=133901 RepID=A0A6J1S1A4_FRAOC|nr:protein ABHD18 isoform X2 [Frankliniella occidentalis]
MSYSSLDQIYRSILLSKYFVKGWGKPDSLKRLFKFRRIISNRDYIYKLIPKDYPITIEKDEVWSDYRVLEGHFRSPFDIHLPNIMPEEVKKAHFQVILPTKWKEENYKPVCLHLAGTGDHYFWKRRNFMCKPLLREAGIGGIILENPFYGSRKPEDQVRSNLHNVSDIFVMGGCLMLESLVLFNWCEQQGLGPLGVTGLSMGGHMASLAATNWPKPIVLVPCLSWSTASGVFTEGVMSGAIPWDVLNYQYFSDDIYREEIRKMVTIIEDDAFKAGQHFIKKYSDKIDNLQNLQPDQQHEKEKSDSNLKSSNGIPASEVLSSKDPGSCPLMAEGDEKKHDSVDLLAKSFAAMSNTIETDTEREKTDAEKEKERLGKDILDSLADSKLQMLTYKVKSSSDQPADVKREVQDYQLRKVVGRKLPFSLLGISPAKVRDAEAMQFMRGIMDECTHLKNFSVPVDTSLIIAICATEDGYVPREGVTHLADVWPGAEVRYINTGHVGAYLLHQTAFRQAIKDGFLRAKEKLNMPH